MKKYHFYRSFGLSIRSEIELPGLPAAPLHEPDIVIGLGHVPRLPRVATLREELAVHSAGASFLIRDGREIIVDPGPDSDAGIVGVLLQGRLMAFLLRQRGWLPLHASGLMIGGHCALFLGIARAGKSTTAAAFHRLGHAVVTDDVAPVRVNDDGVCILQSSWSHVRLRDDAQALLDGTNIKSEVQAGKRRYDLSAGLDSGLLYFPRCAYVLDYGEAIRADPLDPLQAVPLLSQCSFVRRGRMSREAMQAHLRDCSSVARVLPVRHIMRPRSLTQLPKLVRFVEEDLRRLTSSTGEANGGALGSGRSQ